MSSESTQPRLLGPYLIEKRLATGGMGEVYRAYDQRLHRHVALKHILPEIADQKESRQRFLREAKIAARLNHPALVHVHDILEEEDGLWIVMEMVDGHTLKHHLETGSPSTEAVLSWARQIASGLAVAHIAGIVHRDLKTENVILTPDGQIKILDFGLAKPFETLAEDVSLFSTVSVDGKILGTPRALSPEQAQNRKLDGRSDLFSLGVLLHEVLSGRSPFLDPDPVATLTRVCTHVQDPLREIAPAIPSELSDLVDRLLAKDPADRVQSAELVEREIDWILRRHYAGANTATRPTVDSSSSDQSSDRIRLRGERRQLTVLVCELVSLAQESDEFYEMLPRFQKLVTQTAEFLGGQVSDIQGARTVICFGSRDVFEDNARRAIVTARNIGTRLNLIESQYALRAGIHTGPAILQLHPASQNTGSSIPRDTLDPALRLQRRAEPGSILISASTHRLVAEQFNANRQEPLSSGKELLATYEMRSTEPDEPTDTERSSPALIGRDRELRLLLDRWRLALESSLQVILIEGDQGLGKTHLAQAFKRRLAKGPKPLPRWISLSATPETRHVPFAHTASLMRQLFDLDANASRSKLASTVEERLKSLDFPRVDRARILRLIEEPVSAWIPSSSPTWGAHDRSTAVETLTALLMEAADEQPYVMVCENLQWADAATVDLLNRAVDEGAAVPMLMVLTCRPEFQIPWAQRSCFSQTRLKPLAEDEVSRLIDDVAAGHEVSDEAREEIQQRADGDPHFTVELTRQALTLDTSKIPYTLQDVLTARLDRLGAAKEIVQIAAGLGRRFCSNELAELVQLDHSILEHELSRLIDMGVLERKGDATTRLNFRRLLLFEAATESLLGADRRLIRDWRKRIRQAPNPGLHAF